MDSAKRMQYSPISLLRKSVRGDIGPSKGITDGPATHLRATQGLWQATLRLPLKTIQPYWMMRSDSFRMMVKRCCSLVKTASVPRIVKPELLIIEMVAEFVAERSQERAE
jgi:hypothetical protein